MEALEYLQKYSRIQKKDLVLMLRILSLKHNYEVQCNIVNCVSCRILEYNCFFLW